MSKLRADDQHSTTHSTDQWKSVSFGQAIDKITYTNKIPRSEFLSEGPYPIVSQEEGLINGYWDQPADIFRIKRPLTVFGDHTQTLKYIDFDFVLGADGVKVLQAKSFLLPKFFHYQLQSFILKSLGYARHFRLLKEKQVVYPSQPEQERIVAILDQAFEGITTAISNAQENMHSSRALFDSRLDSIFSKQGASWERVTLQKLLERGWIEDHMDGNHGGDYPRKEEFISKGTPYISANCLSEEEVDLSKAKYLAPERAAKLRKGFAKDGDILFAHNATVGPVAILKTTEPSVILGTSLTYYRCSPKRIRAEYLAQYMRSHNFRAQYKASMGQMTRNQVPITKQREFYHVIPPLSEQIQIANELDELSAEAVRLERVYKQKINALGSLKQSLLQQAFSGNL